MKELVAENSLVNGGVQSCSRNRLNTAKRQWSLRSPCDKIRFAACSTTTWCAMVTCVLTFSRSTSSTGKGEYDELRRNSSDSSWKISRDSFRRWQPSWCSWWLSTEFDKIWKQYAHRCPLYSNLKLLLMCTTVSHFSVLPFESKNKKG